jgi:hypothetical protein
MKLHEIQQKLKAPKSQYNSFGKYSYRNAEDILEAVKPLLGRSILTLSDDMVQLGDRYYVKTTATFFEAFTEEETKPASLTNGDIIHQIHPASHTVTAFAREASDRKGMDDSQITGAASSYARKYALNGLFLIDDTKDADHDEIPAQSRQVAPQRTKTADPRKDPAVELLAQKDRVVSLLKQLGFKPVGKTVAEKRAEVAEAVFKHANAELTDTNLEAIAEILSAKVESLEAVADQ